jgi:hypothetical protein
VIADPVAAAPAEEAPAAALDTAAAVTPDADAHMAPARLVQDDAAEADYALDTDVNGNVAVNVDAAADAAADEGKGGRKKSTRPAHKAPTRKPAARSRRPAKPKTPPENG